MYILLISNDIADIMNFIKLHSNMGYSTGYFSEIGLFFKILMKFGQRPCSLVQGLWPDF